MYKSLCLKISILFLVFPLTSFGQLPDTEANRLRIQKSVNETIANKVKELGMKNVHVETNGDIYIIRCNKKDERRQLKGCI
jgi:hypothetical protein